MYTYISEKTKVKAILIAAPFLIVLTAFISWFSQKEFSFFEIQAQLEKKEEISPTEEIVVIFSHPMRQRETEEAISFLPEAEVDFLWEGKQKVKLKPRACWRPETSYSLNIKKAKSRYFKSYSSVFSFEVSTYPKVVFFSPPAGAQDVILDIEEPIIVGFDKSFDNYKFRFSIKPYVDLSFVVDKEKNQIRFVPKEEMRKGEKYQVRIFVRHQKEKEENYKEIFESHFQTKPPPPLNWEKDFNLRLQQARRFTLPKIKEGKYIDLNLKSQVMTLFENGKLLEAYLVSSGKKGMDTPRGTFKISNKHKRAWSPRYGLFMPFWMALVSSGDFGIHELPEWPGGFKEGASHLGTPVSHGCVRLGIGPAERVYHWAEIGTPVIIYE